jgi:CheY-like chemotaxis protein
LRTTILYIEDDEEDVEIFLDAVSALTEPTVCLTSKDGEEALELLQNLIVLPDIIFLDVNMPRMGGKECLKRIKTDDQMKNIPVVIYSTTKNSNEIDEFKELGADMFIHKHSSFKKLCQELNAIMQSTQPSR